MVWTVGSCTGVQQNRDESEVGGHCAGVLCRQEIIIESGSGGDTGGDLGGSVCWGYIRLMNGDKHDQGGLPVAFRSSPKLVDTRNRTIRLKLLESRFSNAHASTETRLLTYKITSGIRQSIPIPIDLSLDLDQGPCWRPHREEAAHPDGGVYGQCFL